MPQTLDNCIFRILNAAGETVGTGFLAAEWLVVTCAHVAAAAAKGSGMGAPGEELAVVWFPDAAGRKLVATVLAQGFSPVDVYDVAFLRLAETPVGAVVAVLGAAEGCAGHDYQTLGFPRGVLAKERGAAGKITRLVNAGDRQGKLIQLEGEVVDFGMSGAPLLDATTDRVIGMITAGERLEFTKLPYATPADHLAELHPDLKLIPPGVEAKPPFLVEPVPDSYVERPDLQEEIIALLTTSGAGQTVGITAALRGAGGYGKTSLARRICHDERVKAAFPGGILWVTLGEKPTQAELIDKARYLIRKLTGRDDPLPDLTAAGVELRAALAGKRALLVVDDAWNAADLKPFRTDGTTASSLITTRHDDALPTGTRRVPVDEMVDEEALALLGGGLPQEECDKLREPLLALAERLGGWALLLGLANAQFRRRMENNTPDAALLDLIALYDRYGLRAFDARSAKERTQAAALAIRASLDALEPAEADRYRELAVFPEDTDVPLAAVERLWSSAGLDGFEAERLCETFSAVSLLQRYDRNKGVRLHDVFRKFLIEEAGGKQDAPPALHEKLLAGYRALWEDGWASGPDDGYYFDHLAYHLKGAGKEEELAALLLDFGWIDARLKHGGVERLIGDYGYAGVNRPAALVESALRMSAHVLGGHPEQAASQLWGRMAGMEEKEIQALLEEAKAANTGPWLRPVRQCLPKPGGAEVRTLVGHEGWVYAVAVTPDGRYAVSGSVDKTLKVWDLATGAEVRTLAGHGGEVKAVAVTPDGRYALSGSDDNTLKVWDLATGAEARTLAGHGGEVKAVAVTPDGRYAVSGSRDKTLKVWDLTTGAEVRTLAGHEGWVRAVAVTADGRYAVSGSSDNTLKVWDLASGAEVRTLAGHDGPVNAVAVTPDGRYAVSGSFDKTLKVWDLATGAEVRTLAGHEGWVRAVVVTADGRNAVSGSFDKTLKVWDLATGVEVRTLTGHGSWVNAVAITPDGRYAVSGSLYDTLKVWDLTTGAEVRTLAGHHRSVTAVAVTPDVRYAVSGSSGGTLKVWDLTTGEEVRTLAGHGDEVNAIEITADGRYAVSGSTDDTLKVWDLVTGAEARTLVGHGGSVYAVAVTADGRYAVSGSWDSTLKVWDLTTGVEVRTLAGHGDVVTAVAVTPDGMHAFSGALDRTIRLWSLETGEEVTRFDCAGGVNAVAVSPDGQTIVAGDGSGMVYFLRREGW